MIQHTFPPEYTQSDLIRIPTPAELEQTSLTPSTFRVIKVEKNTLIWSRTCPQGTGSVVLKLYRNRGLISWQREKIFKFRVEREYNTLAHLVRKQIPCSLPVFWGYGSDGEGGRYELLCTEEIPSATPLKRVAAEDGSAKNDFSPLFRLLRRMHEAGCYHGRLELRDVLCTRSKNNSLDFHIIDTPQAILFPTDITGTRMAMFDLLWVTLRITAIFGTEHCRRLMTDYGLDDDAINRLCKRMSRRGISKLDRNLIRIEFGLRTRIAYGVGKVSVWTGRNFKQNPT